MLNQRESHAEHITSVRKAMMGTYVPSAWANGYMDEETNYFQYIGRAGRFTLKPSEMMALLRQVERDRAADA